MGGGRPLNYAGSDAAELPGMASCSSEADRSVALGPGGLFGTVAYALAAEWDTGQSRASYEVVSDVKCRAKPASLRLVITIALRRRYESGTRRATAR